MINGNGIRLDFRTKLIVTLTLTTVCISGNFEYSMPILSYCISIIPFLFLFKSRAYKMCIKGIVAVIISILLTHTAGEQMGVFSTFALIMGSIVRRMLPGIMMGYYAVSTTNMSDMVASLKRSHLPDTLIIPIAVMFRFFYSLQIDINYISDGMRMYGFNWKTFFKNPFRYFEFKVVPLFMVASRTADDVSISAMSRGLVVGAERSSVSTAKMRMADYFVIACSIGLFGLFIGGKNVGI